MKKVFRQKTIESIDEKLPPDQAKNVKDIISDLEMMPDDAPPPPESK